MKIFQNQFFKYHILLFLTILSFILIITKYSHISKTPNSIDLEEIQKRDTLYVMTGYNSISYFIYRGQPMGFQYEMVNLLAKFLDVKIKISISNDLTKSFKCLKNGTCDIIAVDLTITKERNENFAFTIPHSQTRQVLIQRKPDDWKHISKKNINKSLIRNQTELANKTIYIPVNTSFKPRIENLSEEIGADINIVEIPEIGPEQLIEMVAKGLINYTVCDEHVANVNTYYYDNIDVKTPISFKQNLAWAIQKSSPKLLEAINMWLSEFKETKEYSDIYNKYYRNPRVVKIFESDFYSVKTGRISKYDDIIKKYATEINWDWLLLASLIFHESRFNPDVTSWAGAYGLMQLMPVTAERYGISIPNTPETNIMVGTKYIAWLDKIFTETVPDKKERIKFIIAAYNIGHSHIEDAIRLTDKYGGNTEQWTDVKEYFLLKSKPKYYLDPIVKSGFCKGKSTVKMVDDVIERYENYKIVFKE